MVRPSSPIRFPAGERSSAAVDEAEVSGLLRRLDQAMLADRWALGQRLRRLDRARRAGAGGEWEKIVRAIDASCQRAQGRRAALPRPTYPPELPVAMRAGEIADAIRRSPVVVVCGETGSGKTTQLPKICLEIGRGVFGTIAHTQPRRLAARSVAARIAQELGTSLGEAVGYKVRFADRTSPGGFVKLMTDGILLAETQGDRFLNAYDTIIVDEAHERSLNIDFLLGYLKQLLPRRPDLKIVVTSATIDAERFGRHFDGAPVIEVSGRTFPVEVRHRPLADGTDDDEEPLEGAIVDAVGELWREGPGDVLAFLPGEREIRETADLLRADFARRPWGLQAEILPLYARLSAADQQRIFSPSAGRRVVLATNVAETSLTVPGIRYVVDSGLARVNRYALRSKVQQLQIEKVSRASAIQRAGRCGRVAAGVCVRLYSLEDFESRPAFTDPEILRSSLASVILQMAFLRLGRVDAFPFLDPPSPRAINDGYQLLQELGALDGERRLTAVGRELAKLPVDPRLARIILAGRDHGCLPEILIIVSALSVVDPRERPLDRQSAADQAHLRFRDERSDFLGLLHLWDFFQAAVGAGMSHRRLVDHCRAHFVSYLRLREWRDIHSQLVAQLAELGWKQDLTRPPAVDAHRYQAVHRALLSGLLGNVGRRGEGLEARDEHYQGAREIKFYLHPASGVARKGAKWVVAAELTETTRVFARCVGRVEPEWIEQVAGDRVGRDWFDPRWDRQAGERGEAVASERVTLYGMTLIPRRRILLARVDPALARETFIRGALVAGDFATRAPFLAHNRRLIEEVAELEHKARRQDVLVDEETIFDFYAERIPAEVVSGVAFERWREAAERIDQRVLFITREYLMRHAAGHVTEEQFPEWLSVAGNRLPLKYRFAPGHPLDGLTLTVPLALLNQVDGKRLSWLVPGLVREKVNALIRALPKGVRSRLTPVADFVTAFLADRAPGARALDEELRDYLAGARRIEVPGDIWQDIELPPHLAVNVRVVDDSGQELAAGRDLRALVGRLGDAATISFRQAEPGLERSNVTSWDFGDVPESLVFMRDGKRITGFPALVDDGDSVALRMLDSAAKAAHAHRGGVARLLRLALREQLKSWDRPAPAFTHAALQLRALGSADALRADLLTAVCDRALIGDDPLPRSVKAFEQQRQRARARLPAVAESAGRVLAAIATEYHALTQRIGALPPALGRLATEARRQRDALVYPGFLARTPWEQIGHLPRYLQALQRRLAKYADNPERDARHAAMVDTLWTRYTERLDRNRRAQREEPALEAFRWMIEELRVSLFAQELKTPYPASYKRLERAWQELARAG